MAFLFAAARFAASSSCISDSFARAIASVIRLCAPALSGNTGAPQSQLFEEQVVRITIAPYFATLERLDDRVSPGVIVLGRMLVLRTVAAAHVSAVRADSQMYTLVSGLQTLFAAGCAVQLCGRCSNAGIGRSSHLVSTAESSV